MSWYPMGIPPWPFSFTSLPEHVTFENDKTGETVKYTQHGTCKVEYVSEWMGWHCKACDVLWQGLRDQAPHFCPNCGRRVEE